MSGFGLPAAEQIANLEAIAAHDRNKFATELADLHKDLALKTELVAMRDASIERLKEEKRELWVDDCYKSNRVIDLESLLSRIFEVEEDLFSAEDRRVMWNLGDDE